MKCFVKASLSDCPALNAACLNISTSAQEGDGVKSHTVTFQLKSDIMTIS